MPLRPPNLPLLAAALAACLSFGAQAQMRP